MGLKLFNNVVSARLHFYTASNEMDDPEC